jgi:hypothetical protein
MVGGAGGFPYYIPCARGQDEPSPLGALAEAARARGGKSPPAVEVEVGVLLFCEAMHSSTKIASALAAYPPRHWPATMKMV